MRWAKALIGTLREDPQEAEIASHKLMLRAGLIRRLGSGLYTFMPMGLKALRNVERIVREEMDRAGALEILMPALQPAEIWQQSGRLEAMGRSMFRVRDRQDRTMILGPTHEEVVTELAARELYSYRQVPCTLYQVQTKFRDEIRPRFGLMRAKEFIMKDAYSFDRDAAGAEASYQAMYAAYRRIFARCGVKTQIVEADSGDMGGSASHEFMVPANSGEDALIECPACGYAANQERAERQISTPDPTDPLPATPAPELIDTPNAGAIETVAKMLACRPSELIKTLIFLADGRPVAVMIEGHRDLNPQKLKRALGADALEPADPDTLRRVTGAEVGFAGPIGLAAETTLLADLALKDARNRIVGANQTDRHLKHVDLARDVKITTFADLSIVDAGDACPRCATPLRMRRGIEVGHVFKLGTKYTDAFDAACLDESGQSQRLIMGCYGIGVTRTLQSIIEQHHDADGIVWPVSVSPYPVGLLLLDPGDDGCRTLTDSIAEGLMARGINVLIDDRDERPGVKFKDADLLGHPFRLVVGARAMSRGGVELKRRDCKETSLIAPERVVDTVLEAYTAALTAETLHTDPSVNSNPNPFHATSQATGGTRQ